MDTDYLNLSQAADLFAELTNNPRFKDDIVRIIMLGTSMDVPIFWRNSLHVFTCISDSVDLLPREELKPLPNTEALLDWMQINPMRLRDLEIEEEIQNWTFEIDEEDCYMLVRIGESVFTERGLCKWIRHPVDLEDVTIDRNQLYVVEHHLRRYAAELTSTAQPAKAAAVDQLQPRVTIHTAKPKTRDHPLSPSIAEAQKGLPDKRNTAAVWANMQTLASRQFSNLIGETNEGIQYRKGEEMAFFTRAALEEHLRRQRQKKE